MRLSESSTTASVANTEDPSLNEVAVNYTISSPLRKTLRASIDKDINDEDEKISATFTISSPVKQNMKETSLLANRLQKGFDLEPELGTNSVTATINVPLIANKTTMDVSDRLKKTEDQSPLTPVTHFKVPPIPQPRSLFDIDNATSVKLADKLQQEAKNCDASVIHDATLVSSEVLEPLPPSPIHHTIFGERRSSWRLKCDNSSKVKHVMIFTFNNVDVVKLYSIDYFY